MKNFVKILRFSQRHSLSHSCAWRWAARSCTARRRTATGASKRAPALQPGDGVVGSFFLWKDGSEKAGTFWNELDFEKIDADCRLQSNPIYGNPSANHGKQHALECGSVRRVSYVHLRVDTRSDRLAVRRRRDSARNGRDSAPPSRRTPALGCRFTSTFGQGTPRFGGNFNPSILPVHQYIDWVQFSAYEDGAFKLSWREDFNASTVPDGWLTGSWPSPKNRSTHAPENVNFINGYAVLSLTADDALGATGAVPEGSGGAGAVNGAAGSSGSNRRAAARLARRAQRAAQQEPVWRPLQVPWV